MHCEEENASSIKVLLDTNGLSQWVFS